MEMTNSFQINNQNDGSAELLIYGIVGDYWDDLEAKDVILALNNITAKNLTVRIYSDGGSVFAGLSIYNALKAHQANVTVIIDSLAASIASIIAMAGTVQMPENAFIMIHNPTWGAYGVEADELEQKAKILRKIKDSLITVYKDKTGMDETKLSAMMDKETWLTATEAVTLGFADTVIGSADANNIADSFLNQFKNVPKQLLTLKNQSGENEETEMADKKVEITLDLIKNEHPEIASALINEGKQAELDRVKAVQGQTFPGHEDLIQAFMFDGKTTGPEACMAVMNAEKTIRATAQDQIDDDAVNPLDHVETPSLQEKEDDSEPTDIASAEALWEKDKNLRDEFGNDKESYLGWVEAETSGSVRILGGKK